MNFNTKTLPTGPSAADLVSLKGTPDSISIKSSTEECIGSKGLHDLKCNLPDEMTMMKQFILWRPEWSEEKQKFNKIPSYIVRGQVRDASFNRTDKFLTFAHAQHAVLRSDNNYGIKLGIGFSFVGQDIFSGIDLDGVLVDGKLNAVGQRFLQAIPGWCEISSSGKGLHLFFKTNNAIQSLDNRKNHKAGIEFFCNSGYFALTGRPYV